MADARFIKNKDVIFTRLNYCIDKNFLRFSRNIKFICTPTTGLNHLDLKEIGRRKIKVVSLKGEEKFLSSIRATPEHTLGLALALMRNYKCAFLNKNNNKWERDLFKGYEIYDKNIGIIGFGRVGMILARYLHALGAKVLFYDAKSNIRRILGVKRAINLEKMIKNSDLVFLCASYSEENHGFFGKKLINLLKNKYFINTARGELVDEKYLIKKIKANFFKGVALDVIANEKRKNNLKEFIKLTVNKNFILTPHIAGATYESMEKTEVFLTEKLKKIISN